MGIFVTTTASLTPPVSAEPVVINVEKQFGGTPQHVDFTLDLSAAGFDTPAVSPTYTSDFRPQEHSIEVFWDFDFYATEDETYNAPNALLTDGLFFSKRYGRGPIESTVYLESGPKTVSVMCYEPSSGKIRYGSVTLEVDDVSTLYTGDRFVCVNPFGDSDFSDAPAGAQTYTLGSGETFSGSSAAWTENLVGGANNASGERRFFALKRGATTPVGFDGVANTNLPPELTFGAYGTGTDRANFTNTGTVFFFSGGGHLEHKVQDWEITTTWDAETDSTSAGGTCAIFINGIGGRDTQLYNVFASGLRNQFINQGVSDSAATSLHMSDCILENQGGQYSNLIEVLSNSDTKLYVAGVRSLRNPRTPFENSADIRGLFRFNTAQNILVKSSDFFQCIAGQPALKLQENMAPGSLTNVHSNVFESASSRAIRSGAHSTGTSVVCNFLIDGNYFVGGVSSNCDIYSGMAGYTVRNNVWVIPDMTSLADASSSILNWDRNGGVAADAAPHVAYNNTVYTLRTSAENGGTSAMVMSSNSSWTEVTNENNVIHDPNMSSGSDEGPFDTTLVLTPRTIGRNEGGTFLTSGRATPTDAAVAAVPQSGSNALGAAVSGRVSAFPFATRDTLADAIRIRTGQISGPKDSGHKQVSEAA